MAIRTMGWSSLSQRLTFQACWVSSSYSWFAGSGRTYLWQAPCRSPVLGSLWNRPHETSRSVWCQGHPTKSTAWRGVNPHVHILKCSKGLSRPTAITDVSSACSIDLARISSRPMVPFLQSLVVKHHQGRTGSIGAKSSSGARLSKHSLRHN